MCSDQPGLNSSTEAMLRVQHVCFPWFSQSLAWELGHSAGQWVPNFGRIEGLVLVKQQDSFLCDQGHLLQDSRLPQLRTRLGST